MTQNPPNPGWQPGQQGPAQPQWSPGGQQPQGQPGPPPHGQGFQPQGQPGYGPQGQGHPQHPGQGYQQQGQPGYGAPGPQQYAPQGFQEPPKKKSKTPAIIAGVVALALIVGGVIFGLSFFKGATPAAAKGLPSDVLMAFEINLAPSNSDKLALKALIEKFPVDTSEAGDDYKAALWDLIPDSEDKPDYESEVKPWLGDSVAIGMLNQGAESMDSDASPVVAVETTDKGKAEQFAAKHLTNAKYFFIDSLMVVVDQDEALTADDITKATLADSEEYKADLAKISGSSLATAWLSSAATELAAQQAQERVGGAADLEQIKGLHGAMGLQVSEDMLTIKAGFTAPNAPESRPEDVRDFAKGLPGDALAVLATGTTDEMYTQYWELLSEDPDLQQAASQFGINSVDDLSALFGKKIGISVGMVDSQPIVGAKLTTDDASTQKRILDQLQQVLEQAGGAEAISMEQDGDTAVVAFGQSLDAVKNPSSKLGDVAAYKSVVDGPSQALLFVNMEAVKELPEYQQMVQTQGGTEVSEWLEPITAIGITGNQGSDHYSEALIRVTVK